MTDLAYPLVAIRDDGRTIIARTPEEAADFNRLRPGPKHAEAYTTYDGKLGFTRHEWIVRDHHGRVVLREELPCKDGGRTGWFTRRLNAARNAADRGLPIPGTGARRRYSSGYRGFAVNISMRAAEAALADDLADWGAPHARVGRTRSHDLPQVWDDVAWRGDRRSWKDHRATQWRGGR